MGLECVDMRRRNIGRQFIGIEADDYFFPVCQITDRKRLRRVAVAKEISFSDNRSGQQIRHHRVYTRIAFP